MVGAVIGFDIPGVIQAKARTRMNRQGKLYLPASTAKSQRSIAWLAKQATSSTVDGPEEYRSGRVAVYIDIEERVLRGDLDNKIKTILDGLQDGGLIRNDAQVDEIHISRRKSHRDLCHVSVSRPAAVA